jgi:hypothetical protein
LAFFSQANFAPPKNGRVCNASIVDLISSLPAPRYRLPHHHFESKSPAWGGVSLVARSPATRLISASSDPTTAWMLPVAAFVFVFGIRERNG